MAEERPIGYIFSNLPHQPAYPLCPADPCRSLQQNEAPPGAIPNAPSWLKKRECCVAGADRWKYFQCPLTLQTLQGPSEGTLAAPEEKKQPSGPKPTVRWPDQVTVAVQTDYRESETQTDPYSPDYAEQYGTYSELLTLSSLTWGKGLPAGLAEVEMIERARAKRAWAATLPPHHDLSQLDKRSRMMAEMVANEWAFKESEIQKMHNDRLAVLKQLLREREAAQNDVTSERLNLIYSKLLKAKEAKQQKINNDHMRSLRKLEAKRRDIEGRTPFSKDRMDSFSQTYIPRVHRDFLHSNSTNSNEIKDSCTNTLEETEPGLQTKIGLIDDVIRLAEEIEGTKKDEWASDEEALLFSCQQSDPISNPVIPMVEGIPAPMLTD